MASRSVDQTVTVIDSSLELMNHRVDLRYAFSRYLVWVIPTIGFIGTVVGIAMALQNINPEAPDLRQLTASLGVAFYTTLVALVQSAFLVFGLQLVQASEEGAVNQAGQYVLKNLINRLYVS
jgi:flagellar motor component MotA